MQESHSQSVQSLSLLVRVHHCHQLERANRGLSQSSGMPSPNIRNRPRAQPVIQSCIPSPLSEGEYVALLLLCSSLISAALCFV